MGSLLDLSSCCEEGPSSGEQFGFSLRGAVKRSRVLEAFRLYILEGLCKGIEFGAVRS